MSGQKSLEELLDPRKSSRPSVWPSPQVRDIFHMYSGARLEHPELFEMVEDFVRGIDSLSRKSRQN